MNLKYVEGRFTKDWKPKEEALNNFTISDIRLFSKEFKSRALFILQNLLSFYSFLPFSYWSDFKSLLLQTLREDEEFRSELKAMLTNPNSEPTNQTLPTAQKTPETSPQNSSPPVNTN